MCFLEVEYAARELRGNPMTIPRLSRSPKFTGFQPQVSEASLNVTLILDLDV